MLKYNVFMKDFIKNSILIYGGSKKSREEYIKNLVNLKGKERGLEKDLENTPDLLIVKLEEKNSIGIDEVRNAIKFLNEKPFESDIKYLVVLDAEKLTLEAQNNLLKTLEEPPIYGRIILSSKTESSLLETVISRCIRYEIKDKEREEDEKEEIGEVSYSYIKLKDMSIGERLDFVEELAKEDREVVVEVLENWIRKERKDMNTKNLRKIIEIKEDIENTNVNLRFSLEVLVINLE